MNDLLLQLGQNPQARKLIQSLGLPLPIPQSLARAKGPMEERPLHDHEIVIGGAGELTEVLANTLARAGATALLTSGAHIPESFARQGEAFGRPPRSLMLDALPEKLSVDALVFDATGIREVAGLRTIYEFFHPLVGGLRKCGRVVVLARPAEHARDPQHAAAQAAVEGFVRSLGKELGKRGSTANLLWVDEDADALAEGPLRFLLSKRSAFVSGQPLHVSARALTENEDGSPFTPAWVRPLEGKVALVTGAARGIGKAAAELLAAEGAHVICLDRPGDDELLAETAREVDGTPLLVDVASPEAAQTIARTLKEEHGGVDIVVHNAGITRDKTLARMKPEHWDQCLGINLDAVVRITKALVDEGTLLDEGRVIVLSSIAGIAGNLGQTNYSATKAGVIGWMRSLASDLEERGITVNAIAPGFIETRLTAAIPVVIREVGRRLSSLGQGGLPRDIGDAIVFLSTPGAQGLTGNVLRVCGQSFVGA
jgi:3-oxoacyl-[acyl-carrier protein] reductase